MGLSSALNSAVSGMALATRMAQTTSENLANAQTEGYGRRDVVRSSAELGGVRFEGIRRNVDQAIIKDRRAADSDVGRGQAGAIALSRLEQAVGPVGDANSLSGRLSALEQALISAGGDPSSDVRLRSVVNRLSDVTTVIRRDAEAIKTQREEADRAIARDVESLNTSLKQVEELNADIALLRNSGQDPSALLDARQLVVDKIASITTIRLIDRPNDQIALYTLGGQSLIDGSAAEFTFDQTPTIVPAMTFAGGGLGGISKDGVPLDPNNGFGRLRGGSLEANFRLRDETLTGLQTSLDQIAVDLVRRFEDPTVDPTLGPGDVGLITDSGAALDPLDTVGLSLRLEVNANVDPDRGGLLSNLRDGVNAVAAGPVGNGVQIDSWLSALRDGTTVVPGGARLSAAGHAGAFIADVGKQRLDAEESLSFAQARQERLLSAELANGVDSDLELQNLLRIEQAYAANVRVVQAVDQMMRNLLEI